ncbi:MAG: twin-arginine translocase subunit TatC, partial [Pseudanabaena sp.]
MLETVTEADQPKDLSNTQSIEDVNEAAIAVVDPPIVDEDLEVIEDVEMSLFDHLEELRSRI